MPAMTLPFEQIDAFTSQPFAGNPAAVLPLLRFFFFITLQPRVE